MKLKRNSRWTVSYIDLLMTILGFFVLLYAREHDPKEVADSLRSAFTHEGRNQPKNKGTEANTPKISTDKVVLDNQTLEETAKTDSESADPSKRDHNKDTPENCLTKAGAACPMQDFLADDLFQPQEAILTDKGKAALAHFVRKAAKSSADLMIESHGIGNGNARFDRWELAAARTASVARQLKSSGIDDTHLKMMMAPDTPLADNGQHILITIGKKDS